MSLVRLQFLVLAAVLLLYGTAVSASTITSAAPSTSSLIVAPTCEFRTINYITDSLPQLCFKSSWSNLSVTSSASTVSAQSAFTSGEAVESILSDVGSGSDARIGTQTADITQSASAGESHTASISSAASEPSTTDLESGELNDASFLSFEEWKKQTLEKAGQADANIGKRRQVDGKKRDSSSFQNHLDSMGEEGEIDIDLGFGNGGRDGGNGDGSQKLETGESPIAQEKAEKEQKSKDQYRSKDAGKTCKERFSYASFDAGATIVKTHPGAKNSKAVLIENKDSYMLSECSTKNKFLIVELSEDIWIDTVVLANYEFFSSMIRTFRVSVSDRYPAKADKWKDVGTFEARNSREIQPFLIENPQIWARYIMIEFLTHYGNEYYCPLSLLRVHGTRMLESWKESEASAEDEENDESEGETEEPTAKVDVAEQEKQEELLTANSEDTQVEAEPAAFNATDISGASYTPEPTSPWNQATLDMFCEVTHSDQCVPSDSPLPQIVPNSSTADKHSNITLEEVASSSSAIESSRVNETLKTSASQVPKPTTVKIPPRDSLPVSPGSDKATPKTNTQSSTSSTTVKTQNGTNSTKSKTSSTASAASSLPTIQESFFKAVSRRLTFLETNSTLSLKYIEEQSRILREAFTRVEKKQLQKTTVFLETLNSTVLDELRGFRQQYDEIWQSTVISLETQREANRKELFAITSRLNILADEVVFQKRMSIVQSVLLLICLGLVIFSRVSGGGNMDMTYLQGRVKNMYNTQIESPIESPPDSPTYHRTGDGRDGHWLEVKHTRHGSDEMDGPLSRSRSRETSDETPASSCSQSEDVGLTPPRDIHELNGDDSSTLTHSRHLAKEPYRHTTFPLPEESESPVAFTPPQRVQTPKRQKPLVRQEFNVPENSSNWPLRADPSPLSSGARARLSSQHLHPQLSKRQQKKEEKIRDEEQKREEAQESEREVSEAKKETLNNDTRPSNITQSGLKESSSSYLPSPPLENGNGSVSMESSGCRSDTETKPKRGFSIVRKPLPALPEGSPERGS